MSENKMSGQKKIAVSFKHLHLPIAAGGGDLQQ